MQDEEKYKNLIRYAKKEEREHILGIIEFYRDLEYVDVATKKHLNLLIKTIVHNRERKTP